MTSTHAMTQRLTAHSDLSRSMTLLSTPLWALGLAVLGLFLLTAPAQAQEEGPEAQRLEGVTWNSVVLIDFKAGEEDRAMEIASNNFIAASKKAGTQVPRVIDLQTGPWDTMLVWTMEDGPSEMTWETSPEQVKHQKTMMEMVGGKKEMEKTWEEYTSLINRSTSFIGYSGEHGAPITAEVPE
jgi:hypothetical protein